MQQQQRGGFADDVAAADDDCALAGDGDLAAPQDLDQPGGRTGDRPRPLRHQRPHVEGVKAVDVFLGRNFEQDARRIDLRRQRQLHQDAVDVIPRVEPADQFEQFRGGCACGGRDRFAVNADLLAGPNLVSHVDLRSGVVTHQHGG